MNAMGQTIVIHANRNLGISQLRQGFVHGINYEKGKDYSKTIALISALKPMVWRLSSHGNLYGFVVGEAKLPQVLGTETIFVMQDLFNVKYGFDVRIRRICFPNQTNCFSSYASLKKSWLGVLNAAIRTDAEKRLSIDYIDVFAEPEYGSGKLDVTPEQLGDLFKSTHDTVRQYRPNAKFVAPSISSFNGRYLQRFLAVVAEYDLRLDAVSWHEFDAPEFLPAHVNEIRALMTTQPKLCNPKCPEIHVNEYASEDQQTPGYGVGWLYYLEQARVDKASRACWDLPKGESTCWAGFNGLLSQDNVTPLPLYWAYKAYADMNDAYRVVSESSLPQTIAIAGKVDSKREFRILAGKYGQKGTSSRVAIEVRDFRDSMSSVIAEISRIPDSVKAAQSFSTPPLPLREVIRVQDNSFSIVIPDFRDGEAYSIVVRPGGYGGAR